MKEFHLETEPGKNSKVGITRAQGKKVKTLQVTKDTNKATETVRVLKGEKPDAVTANELIDSDPEIDLENIGLVLEQGTRAYFKPGKKEVEGGFQEFDVILSPTGEVKSKKPHEKRKANINDTQAIKITKRIPIAQALQQFVFVNHYALYHDDGLKYDFLYNLAKDLESKGELAKIGAGPKGLAPLVFIDGGSPYQAFLYGATDGDKYKLLVLLSNQELKVPEGRNTSEHPQTEIIKI